VLALLKEPVSRLTNYSNTLSMAPPVVNGTCKR